MNDKRGNKGLKISQKAVHGIEDWCKSGLGGDAQVVQMASGVLTGEIFHAFLGGGAIGVCWIDRPLHHRGPVTSDAVTFSMCLNLVGSATQRGRNVSAGDIAIYPGDSERDTFHNGSFYRYFALAVPNERLLPFLNVVSPEHLPLLDSASIYKPARRRPIPPHALEEAARFLKTMENKGINDFNARIFNDSILSCFLAILPEKSADRNCAYPSADRRLVLDAEDLIRSDETVLGVPALCISLGVSRRTLERAFQRIFDMSPVHYLTLFRLCRARLDFANEGGSVSCVAMKHGFYELGRFSRRYKQLFGELPSETRAAGGTPGSGSLSRTVRRENPADLVRRLSPDGCSPL